jgi:hypothetical protein
MGLLTFNSQLSTAVETNISVMVGSHEGSQERTKLLQVQEIKKRRPNLPKNNDAAAEAARAE